MLCRGDGLQWQNQVKKWEESMCW